MGAHDFKVPLFAKKISEYQCFAVCCPETSSCASKPLLLRCKLVIPQCLCQVSLGLKEVQMGARVLKLNKVHHFAQKRQISMFVGLLPRKQSLCQLVFY